MSDLCRLLAVPLLFLPALAGCGDSDPVPADEAQQQIETPPPGAGEPQPIPEMDAELSASNFEYYPPLVAGRPGALYGSITGGAEPDSLTGISIGNATVELHRSEMQDGKMAMTQVDGIPVEAGATVALRQGGLHGMVMDAPNLADDADSVAVTLTFENAGSRTVDAAIRSRDTAE